MFGCGHGGIAIDDCLNLRFQGTWAVRCRNQKIKPRLKIFLVVLRTGAATRLSLGGGGPAPGILRRWRGLSCLSGRERLNAIGCEGLKRNDVGICGKIET